VTFTRETNENSANNTPIEPSPVRLFPRDGGRPQMFSAIKLLLDETQTAVLTLQKHRESFVAELQALPPPERQLITRWTDDASTKLTVPSTIMKRSANALFKKSVVPGTAATTSLRGLVTDFRSSLGYFNLANPEDFHNEVHRFTDVEVYAQQTIFLHSDTTPQPRDQPDRRAGAFRGARLVRVDVNATCDAPGDQQTAYSTTDTGIEVWAPLPPDFKGGLIRVTWFGPVFEQEDDIYQTLGCPLSTLRIKGAPPASLPGRWYVGIWYNEQLETEWHFTITGKGALLLPPPVPTDLSTTRAGAYYEEAQGVFIPDDLTTGSIQLTWAQAAGNTGTFRIERSTDDGPFTVVADAVAGNLRSYSDGTVLALHKYCYRVAALNVEGISASSTARCEGKAKPMRWPR
jgi:hypothetical protein